jgi:hypothetical protein
MMHCSAAPDHQTFRVPENSGEKITGTRGVEAKVLGPHGGQRSTELMEVKAAV